MKCCGTGSVGVPEKETPYYFDIKAEFEAATPDGEGEGKSSAASALPSRRTPTAAAASTEKISPNHKSSVELATAPEAAADSVAIGIHGQQQQQQE